MLYEINVMKPYILNTVRFDLQNPEELEVYKGFEDKYLNVPEIPSGLIPSHSVFREFIGRKQNS